MHITSESLLKNTLKCEWRLYYTYGKMNELVKMFRLKNFYTTCQKFDKKKKENLSIYAAFVLIFFHL